MWPFRSKPLLDAEDMRWHFDNAAWLARNLGSRAGFGQATLVLPDLQSFDSDGLAGHALALALFEQVKAYCGLREMPVILVRAGTEVAGSVAPQIAYTPGLIANPQSFIAAMAHELARYILAKGVTAPSPLGSQEDGLLADLAAIHLGFGVFLANSAFKIETQADGWSYSRQGYLPEPDLVFALAVFLKSRQLDPAQALRYLKADLGAMLRRGLRDLQSHEVEIAALRQPDPGQRKQSNASSSVVT
jgi:hypothetical protein